MHYSTIRFGKHAGLTIPQLVWRDPDYFFWAVSAGVFRGGLAEEARFVAGRAHRIQIPQPDDGSRCVAEYVIHSGSGKFGYVRVVRADGYRDPDADRRHWLDLGFAHACCNYDKTGGRMLVRQVKETLWGNESYRVTRDRATAFFDDDSNFVLEDLCPYPRDCSGHVG